MARSICGDRHANRISSVSRASAAATAAAPTTPVTAAAATARTILRFVDFQRSTAEVRAVQRLHGLGRIGVRHFNESESTWLASFPVHNQRKGFDGAVSREEGAQGVLGRGKGQIANVEFGHFGYSQKMKVTRGASYST
jgi:hypothetical protein